METQRTVFGENDVDTVASMGNLAAFYAAQGRHAEALPIALKVLEIRTRLLGEDHPSTLRAIHNVATYDWRLHEYLDAEPLFRKGLDGRRRVLGDAHPDTASTVSNLSAMYLEQRRYVEAESLLTSSYRSFSDKESVWKERIAQQLVTLYDTWNRPAKAAEWRATMSATQQAIR